MHQQRLDLKRSNVILLCTVFAAVGFALLSTSSAATFTSSSEPESGQLTGSAKVISSAGQSGTGAIQFGASPGGGQTCTGATHIPGGSDGNGGCWPGATNTGVPAGISLTNYTGPMTISAANTVIDSKTINGTLVVAAPNVTIKNSKINGNIDVDGSNRNLILLDSEVDGGTSNTPAIGYSDITMKRVNSHGSRVTLLCGDNCDIQDSWFHDQYLAPGTSWHVNGYVSNGGSNALIQHNTIGCDTPDNANGGGCTGPAASFGDFAALVNITYNNNLITASPGGYCLAAGHNPGKPYGSNPTNITVTNNIFQRGSSGKCASFGPVTSFLSANGNVWSNNKYADGMAIPAAD